MKRILNGPFSAPQFKLAPDAGGATGGSDAAILDAVKEVRTSVDQKFDELHKSTRATIEDLTKVKNDFNGLSSDLQTVTQLMKKLQGQLALEQRMAFGNPIERIVQDEEKRTLLLARAFSAASRFDSRVKLTPAMQKALDTANSPGSTLIDSKYLPEVYDVLATYGIWNTFKVINLGSKTTVMPVKTARVAAPFLTSEAGAITPDSTKAGTTVSATVSTIGAVVSASLELMQDSEIDLARDILDDCAESVASRMDWACTQADGGADSTDGGFTGIFGGGGTAVNAAGGNTTMETLDFEDWTAVVIAAAAISDRMLKWWMHPAILTRALHTKDGNGRPIFLTAVEAPAPGNIGSILGYPVVLGHQCPSTNSASAKVAVLGDPNGAVFGIRKDFEFMSDNSVGFDEYAVYFRAVARIAFKVRAATAFRVLTLAAA